MKKNYYFRILLPIIVGALLCGSYNATIYAQTIVTTNAAPYDDPSYLISNILVGGCLTIDNITYAGNPSAIGYFSNGMGSIGIEEGIVLSSGNIGSIGQPAINFASTTWLAPGDPQLDALNPNPSNDASVLTFSFNPLSSTVSFDYVFASEEYPEWVGSAFNDVFAFFISGPGIAGSQNIALVPGTTTQVAINTVNLGINSQYYITNTGGSNVFDAYTTVLTATIGNLTPCATYTIKLAICDTQDWSFDSAVFLGANTFTAGEAIDVQAVVPASTSGANAYEGCQDGYFIITRPPDGDLSQPFTVNVVISGTATPGTDYVALPTSVTIPAGESSVQLPVDAFADNFSEGSESISLQVNNYLCDCTQPPPATLNIYDSPVPFQAFASSGITICPGDDVLIAVLAQGSQFTPYTYQWDNGATFPGQFVAPTTTTTYTVTITDQCGRTVTGSVVVNVSNQPPNATITAPASVCSTDAPIALQAPTAGGVWAGPGIDPDTGLFDPALAAASGSGPYTITYSINNSCGTDQGQAIIAVNTPGNPIIDPVPPICADSGNSIVLTANNVGGTWSGIGIVGGTNTTGLFDPAAALASGTPPPYTITYTITGNCAGTSSIPINVNPLPTANISGNATICGATTANLTVNFTGTPPFSLLYAIDGNQQTAINGIVANPYALVANQAGTYTLNAVNDAGNCPNVGTGTAVVTQSALTVDVTAGDALCNGGEGSISVVAGGGTNPLSYTWSDATLGNNAIVNAVAGNYSVTVTDQVGCSASATATIDQPAALSVDVNTSNACFNENNGQINLTVNNATTPLQYTWSNPAFNGNPITTAAQGNYTVTITDATGCTTSAAVVVDANLPLTFQIDGDTSICTGQTTTLSTTAVFDTYQWSNGETTANISVNTAGTYSVTVSDAAGCSNSATTTITLNTVAVSMTPTQAACAGQGGTITLAPTSGTSPYTYTWNDSSIGNVSVGNNLAAGVYTATVSDSNGCTATNSAEITTPIPLQVTPNITHILCAGSSTGTIDLSTSGGTGPYTYTWSNPVIGNSATANGLAAGPYTVTVSDNNNCSITANVLINEPTPLQINANPTDLICNGNNSGRVSIDVAGGVPPYIYTWSIAAIGNNAIAENLPAGPYAVTVTDLNGCSQTAATVLNEPAILELSTTATNITCAGNNNGSITTTPSGGTEPYSFSWHNGLIATATQNALGEGNYQVTVSDANGCVQSAGVDITMPQPLDVQYTATPVACEGLFNGSIDLSVSGGTSPYQYDWPFQLSDIEDQIDVLGAGVYDVVVTDANACSIQISIELSAPEAMNISGQVAEPLCAESTGTIDLSVTGGSSPYFYNWSGTLADQEDQVNTLSGNATYTVTVNDSNGCEASASFTLNAPAPLTAAFSTTPPSCNAGNNGSISVDVSGGTMPYNYQWTSGIPDIEDPDNLLAGNYSLTITDANGCSVALNDMAITNPPLLSVSVTTTPTTCGNADGSATATALGGTGNNYTFLWSNGTNNSIANDLAAAAYTVTVTDINGCTASTTAAVANLDGPVINVQNQENTTCGQANGQINITVTTTTNAYTLLWDNGATTANVSNLLAGTYNVTATDANGCQAVESIVIEDAAAPVLLLNLLTDATCGDSNGSIALSATGGTGSLTYAWSSAGIGNTNNATNLAAGDYSATVSDQNGCIDTLSTTISNSTIPQIIANGTNETCGAGNGSIFLITSNGTGPYSYAWLPNAAYTADTALNLIADTYFITVTDANGCSSSTQIVIDNEAAPAISILTSTNSACGQAIGAIEWDVSGGTAPFTYQWNDPTIGNTTAANQLPAGNYTITVSDANACTAAASADLSDLSGPTVATNNVIQATCGNNNGAISLSASGGTGTLTAVWSDANIGNVLNASDLAAGVYNITVTDENNCSENITVTLNNSPPITLAAGNLVNAACGQANGSVAAIASGGTGNLSYTWQGNVTGNQPTADNLSAGVYSVTVTDELNCSASISLNVNNDNAPVIDNIAITPAFCDQANGTAIVNASGGTGNLIYTWQNGVAGNLPAATDLLPGSYAVTVSDENNCAVADNIIIPNIAGPVLTSAVTGATCSQANGSAIVSVSGGAAPYSYTWNGTTSATDSTANNLSAGLYSVTATDANGCTAALDIEIINSNGPTITLAEQQNATCGADNGSATVSVSGGASPYSYTWSGTTSAIDSTANNLSAGLYGVTATDATGCTAILNIEIINSNGPNVSVSTTPIICGENNGVATATANGGSGGYTYSWNTVPEQTLSTATGLGVGDYNVTVTDSNGCSDSAAITLLGTVPAPQPICGTATGNSISVSWSAVSGATGYVIWVNGEITDTLSATVFTYTAEGLLPNTTATIDIVALGDDLCSNSISTSVSCTTLGSPCPPLPLSIEGLADSYCADAASVQLNATPAGGIFSIDGIPATLLEPANLSIGSHTVVYTLTQNDTCIYTASQAITINPLPSIGISLPDAVCAGNAATLSLAVPVQAGFIYTWQTDAEMLSGAGPHSVVWDNEGQHNVGLTVETLDGCMASTSGTIAVSAIQLFMPSDTTIIAGTEIQLPTTISGNTGTVQYEWLTQGILSCTDCSSPSAQPAQTTIYTLNVADSLGCSTAGDVTITVFYPNKIIIPNAFSPNGNGINDVFRVFGYNITEIELRIRDRWGKEVFKMTGNDLSQGWDGTYPDGQEAEIGAYAYYVQVRFLDNNEELFKGNVTLVR